MNRRKRAFLIKALLFLVAFNIVSLSVVFLRQPRPTSPTVNNRTITENHHSALTENRSTLKPWPTLPSFLPWTPNPNPPPRSCEAYFGNGFSRRIDLLRPSTESDGRGWLRCFYSETLASSICEMGAVRMDPGRIRMSDGGESLEKVIGRREEEELPVFEPGAFQIEAGGGGEGFKDRNFVNKEFLDQFVPHGAVHLHTMRALLDSIRLVGPGELECSQWINDPTLLVTRFEYANLFHTVTDWYSAYVTSRVTSLPNRPHLVFVDGHCKAPLEETWEALFSSLRYAKNFSGPVCFRHAVLSPLGYETAMFKGLTEPFSCHGTHAHILRKKNDDRKTARLSEFGEMLRAAFNLSVDENLRLKPATGHNVLFVRREDYLAHPRHDGKVQSRLTNEQEVFDSLKSWAAAHTKCKINLINGLFAHMPMKEQLRAIQEASVVIGAHGAGLTHLVAATPNTIVLEIISSLYRRPHFSLISEWKGLKYHAINLVGSFAEPGVVIDRLSSIMSSLGC